MRIRPLATLSVATGAIAQRAAIRQAVSRRAALLLAVVLLHAGVLLGGAAALRRPDMAPDLRQVEREARRESVPASTVMRVTQVRLLAEPLAGISVANRAERGAAQKDHALGAPVVAPVVAPVAATALREDEGARLAGAMVRPSAVEPGLGLAQGPEQARAPELALTAANAALQGQPAAAPVLAAGSIGGGGGGSAGQNRAPRPWADNPLPAYPAAAREDGLEGVVRLLVEVSIDGRVAALHWASRSGVPLLDLAARDAVRHWRFQPALRAGEPVAGVFTVSLHFRLQGAITWLAQANGGAP